MVWRKIWFSDVWGSKMPKNAPKLIKMLFWLPWSVTHQMTLEFPVEFDGLKKNMIFGFFGVQNAPKLLQNWSKCCFGYHEVDWNNIDDCYKRQWLQSHYPYRFAYKPPVCKVCRSPDHYTRSFPTKTNRPAPIHVDHEDYMSLLVDDDEE